MQLTIRNNGLLYFFGRTGPVFAMNNLSVGFRASTRRLHGQFQRRCGPLAFECCGINCDPIE
jgi:hypothetical protein